MHTCHIVAPSVHFLKPTPKHVHVYTNGDICLNLLGRDWRPMITAEVCHVMSCRVMSFSSFIALICVLILCFFNRIVYRHL